MEEYTALKVSLRGATIRPGEVAYVKCQVPADVCSSDSLVLFELKFNSLPLEKLDIGEKQDVAYVAALNLAQDPEPHGMGPLPTIDHDELVKAQREDPANWGPNKIEGNKGGLVKCRQTKCEWPPAKTHA